MLIQKLILRKLDVLFLSYTQLTVVNKLQVKQKVNLIFVPTVVTILIICIEALISIA